MAKSFSAPLERTARLLDLVPYINSHQGIALKDLAAVFDVSNAQMINDLTTLWMCGLPGYTPLELMELDFESGYVNISNAPTLSKPRSVTFDEGVSLVLGLELLRSSISSDRADLLEKVDSLALRLSSIINLPSVFSVTTTVNQKISGAIAEALASQSGLEIQYHSLYRDEITQRKIFPIEALDVDGVQYLSAYCYEASDFRQFKIERIQSAGVIQIERRVAHSVTQNQGISSVIKVLKPSRELAERFNLTDATVGSELSYETYSQQWLERSVLAAGGAAALVSPPEIRASIAQMAQSMLDRYKAE